jgi:hypothetical protein
VKEERGTIANVNVDVSKRCKECGWLSSDGFDHVVRVPISPNYLPSAREYTYEDYDQHVQRKIKDDGRSPDTVDTLGAKTGVTKISPPTKN